MEIVNKKAGEVFEIALDSRGATGLQMQFKTDVDGVVSVERTDTVRGAHSMAGDPVKAVFEVRTLQPGNVTILFFETRPWDKNFQPIPATDVMVKVTER
jgi:predicted secreted protein